MLIFLIVLTLVPAIRTLAKRHRTRQLRTELEWLNYFLYTQSKQPSVSIRELHVAVNIEDIKSSIRRLQDAIDRKIPLTDRTIRNMVNCLTVCRGLMDDASRSGQENIFRVLGSLQAPLVLLTEQHVSLR